MICLDKKHSINVVALAGGVGGAKMVDGLARVLTPDRLTVIVNTGDDFEHLGLYICPDIDTICYTLAGIANVSTGWGRSAETWNALDTIKTLGGETWFKLGDRDLGTHLIRTEWHKAGKSLSQITCDFCKAWGIQVTVLPMSDEVVRTMVITRDGNVLPFQEYFVKYQCQPEVSSFIFEGIEQARPAPGVLSALENADLIIICPSNPWVSIDPILSVKGIRQAISNKTVIAISPIIQGKTVKGPAAKMFAELDIQPSASAVAFHYKELLSGYVLDRMDGRESRLIAQWGIIPYETNILIPTREDRIRLACEVLTFYLELRRSS